jgi:opacity protein-like surface antigen
MSKFTDVEMPVLGESLAATTTNPDLTNPTGNPFFQLTQNLQTDDVKLKRSWVAGGKLGYFFSQQGFPWLGIELEAFLTNPKIKSQTLGATQDVTRFNPTPSPNGPTDNPGNAGDTEPTDFSIPRSISLDESNLFVTTLALNGVLRYPGTILQPYIGAGIGGFWFRGNKQFDSSKIVPGLNAFAGLKVKATEEWGVFIEGKYNRATLNDFGPEIGLRGNYSLVQWLAGLAFHF